MPFRIGKLHCCFSHSAPVITRTSEIQSDKGIRHSLAALLTTITLLHDLYIRQSLTALSIGSYMKYIRNKVKVDWAYSEANPFFKPVEEEGARVGWGMTSRFSGPRAFVVVVVV